MGMDGLCWQQPWIGRDRCMGWLLSTSGWRAITERAKSLYASFGFETYGIEKQAILFNGEYFDEDLMALHLHSPSDPGPA